MSSKDQKREFELELFRQTNEHMRATDRKLWISTGAYISVFFLYLARVDPNDFVLHSPLIEQRFEAGLSIIIHLFYGGFGLVIYLMERWYRAWKVHYLRVLFGLRSKLYPDKNDDEYLPFWLQSFTAAQPINVDDTIKLVTFTLSSSFTFLAVYEIYVFAIDVIGKIAAVLIAILYVHCVWRIRESTGSNVVLRA